MHAYYCGLYIGLQNAFNGIFLGFCVYHFALGMYICICCFSSEVVDITVKIMILKWCYVFITFTGWSRNISKANRHHLPENRNNHHWPLVRQTTGSINVNIINKDILNSRDWHFFKDSVNSFLWSLYCMYVVCDYHYPIGV